MCHTCEWVMFVCIKSNLVNLVASIDRWTWSNSHCQFDQSKLEREGSRKMRVVWNDFHYNKFSWILHVLNKYAELMQKFTKSPNHFPRINEISDFNLGSFKLNLWQQGINETRSRADDSQVAIHTAIEQYISIIKHCALCSEHSCSHSIHGVRVHTLLLFDYDICHVFYPFKRSISIFMALYL